MKIYRKAIFQMTSHGYEPVFEDSFEYAGLIAEAKGSSGGSTIDPATMEMLTNQSAALNRTNTTGTYGKSTWSVDPKTGRYTQDVSLDPSQQRQLDLRNSIAEQLMGSAQKNFGSITSPFGYSSDVSPSARAGFDAAVQRYKPQFDQENRTFDQTQANNGIPIGSEAYGKEQQKLQQGQNDLLQQAASGAANTQNSMDLSQRQQNYSDIANMLGTQNTAQPTVGTNAAIDTTGNFNTLNSGVNALINANRSSQQQGQQAGLTALLAFL